MGPQRHWKKGGRDEEVRMGKFGLTKRCRCPRRAWTIGCRHSWYCKFKWKGRRYRAALDDVLNRHVSGKSEALQEVEKIYDAIKQPIPETVEARLRTMIRRIDARRRESGEAANGSRIWPSCRRICSMGHKKGPHADKITHLQSILWALSSVG